MLWYESRLRPALEDLTAVRVELQSQGLQPEEGSLLRGKHGRRRAGGLRMDGSRLPSVQKEERLLYPEISHAPLAAGPRAAISKRVLKRLKVAQPSPSKACTLQV